MPSRELSQFASLVVVTNAGKDILLAPSEESLIGIGTDSVTNYKLDLNGSCNISNNLVVSGIITGSAFYDSFGAQLQGFDSWEQDGLNIYRLNGNVGIGTSAFDERFVVIDNIKANQFISTTTTEAPFIINSTAQIQNLNADRLRGGIPGQNNSGDIVTTDGNQSLTNKTFTNPIVDGTLSLNDVTLTAPNSGGPYNIEFPSNSGTLITDQDDVIIGLVTTGDIQNGTILNEDIANLTITAAKIANSTISNSKLQNSTISGVSLGSTLAEFNITSDYFNTSNISYDGSTEISITLLATPNNTSNHLVARDSSGDFSASQINAERFEASTSIYSNGVIGCANTITAQDFNSTSDLLLKHNIHTISNSLDIISQLRGVEFMWNNNNKKSYGVIAQELETVLPELVNTDKFKSVNYIGLIGILIQAINELRIEVEMLKNK